MNIKKLHQPLVKREKFQKWTSPSYSGWQTRWKFQRKRPNWDCFRRNIRTFLIL